jgi:hypothetical protein
MKSHRRVAGLVLATFLPAGLLAISDAAPGSPDSPTAPSATYIRADEVKDAIRGLSPQLTDDEPVRVVDLGSYSVGLFVVGRPRPTGPALAATKGEITVTEGLQLDHVTVVLQILDGAGTLITGGTLADSKRLSPVDPDLPVVGPGSRGKIIRGGSSQIVGRGDIIIIPPGVAHGFSQVKEPLVYSAIRIDPQHALQLK